MPTLAERLREEGRNEGKEKWMNEEKRQTARRMLREDFTIEQIARSTGLSEEELKKVFSEK